MYLLERENYLKDLNGLLENAKEGCGKAIAIAGEAGVGKTSLVEEFTSKLNKEINILWGACDSLLTPRPLAPFYDICYQMKNSMPFNLENELNYIFSSFFNELQKGNKTTVIIIEDIHWADESTLDFIKFLSRRINKNNIILITTFRDDEISSNHPVRFLFGDIPQKNTCRIELLPLSEKSVNDLAKIYGLVIPDLYKKTNGNPLFVTEVIAAKNENIPITIKDMVLAKLFRLTNKAKNLIELISVIPGKIEIGLIKQFAENLDDLDECIQSGILKSEPQNIIFRHELIRLAIEDSLTQLKKEKFNSQILNYLLQKENPDKYLASVVHHAVNANKIDIILKYAPQAAKQASKLGAHYQASKHYLTALQFADHLSKKEHLTLLEGRAYECNLTGQIDEGIKAGESIIEIMKDYHDPYREGENYRILSRLMWFGGQDEKGEEYLDKAIKILENLHEDKQLAMAYSNKSQIYMVREITELAIKWGEQAIKIAKRMNYPEIEIHSLNNIGAAKMFAGEDKGEYFLQKSLELSILHDFHDHIGRVYDNLGTAYLYRRNLSKAVKYFSTGIEYCSEKDLNAHGLCMTAEMAKTKLTLGKWEEAINLSNMNLNSEHVPIIDKVIPLCVIGTIRARRNDPGSLNTLNEAKFLAMKSGEAGKIVTTISAIAEAYWLKNNLNEIVDEIDSVYLKIIKTNNSWSIGELAFWLWKGKRLSEIPKKIAKPFLYQIKGDWKSAAKLWEELKCPYEQALALSDGNEQAMKKAIEIFDCLGASAASQLVKQKMRELGIKSIPKGPRKTTKENQFGLTIRQLEVLDLISKGLSNIEIGNQLYISPKTVDHHISAILSKLNIHSRAEAASLVHSQNLFPKNGE